MNIFKKNIKFIIFTLIIIVVLIILGIYLFTSKNESFSALTVGGFGINNVGAGAGAGGGGGGGGGAGGGAGGEGGGGDDGFWRLPPEDYIYRRIIPGKKLLHLIRTIKSILFENIHITHDMQLRFNYIIADIRSQFTNGAFQRSIHRVVEYFQNEEEGREVDDYDLPPIFNSPADINTWIQTQLEQNPDSVWWWDDVQLLWQNNDTNPIPDDVVIYTDDDPHPPIYETIPGPPEQYFRINEDNTRTEVEEIPRIIRVVHGNYPTPVWLRLLTDPDISNSDSRWALRIYLYIFMLILFALFNGDINSVDGLADELLYDDLQAGNDGRGLLVGEGGGTRNILLRLLNGPQTITPRLRNLFERILFFDQPFNEARERARLDAMARARLLDNIINFNACDLQPPGSK